MWTKTLQVGCASALIALSSNVIAASKYGVELSGQVNRAIMYADDGVDSDTFFVDNDNSSTRFRIISKAKMSDDVTVGANMETQQESNSSSSVTMGMTNSVGGGSFTERKLELYFDSKTLGRLWLGQGDTATNGTSEYDLSGTSLIGYSSIGDIGGSLKFRHSKDRAVEYGDIGDYYSNMDGLSRDDRVRYDTPNLGGFKLSVSASTGEKYDVGLHFKRKFGDFSVAAGLGYADGGDAKSWDTQLNGSLSLLYKGFSVTLAAGKQDLGDDDAGNDRDDPAFYYTKLGYQFKASSLGKTAFSIDYGRGEDFVSKTELDTYGLQFVQKIDKVATELYVGIRNNQLDITGNDDDDIEDILTVVGGARVKF